jgi:hypothetical protein
MVRLLDPHRRSTNHGRRVVEEFVVQLGITCDDRLEDLLRQAGHLNATDLAEGIVLALNIPAEAVGGDTLGRALRYVADARYVQRLPNGLDDPDDVLPAHAASLAAESLVEASRANGWARAGEPNHVCTVLEAAYAFAARKVAA